MILWDLKEKKKLEINLGKAQKHTYMKVALFRDNERLVLKTTFFCFGE